MLRRFVGSSCKKPNYACRFSSSLPSETDVVVIGGGSLGCNTIYHLAKLGVNRCVLLERDKLTSGTTWHTAGLLWRLRPNDVDMQLIERTRYLNSTELPEITGQETGWINNGGMFIASTKQRLDEYKRLMTIGKTFGVDSHVVGPNEMKKIYPLMNIDDVYGGLYSPGDGLIEASGFCSSLTKAAKKFGAQVFEDTPVKKIETVVDDFGVRRVSGVITEQGRIACKAVVNCAGAWAREVEPSVTVPLKVQRHAYVVTGTIDGIRGMPNVRDHDKSVYLRLQGDTLCVGGYEYNPTFIDDLPSDFAFGLFDLDYDVFGVHLENGAKRVPAITDAGIKSEVCGPESFTADHMPLLGESPELRGFFLGCAFNSAGMMYGGGCGEQLAHWVIDGRPRLHMHRFDIRRFHPALTKDSQWVKERSHESYAKNYSIVFPHDEPLAGRNKRKDPLFDKFIKAGCVFQERQGFERPSWFTNHPCPLKPYDYYGAYDTPLNVNYEYKNVLNSEYSFDFPDHHDIIEDEALACRSHAALFNMSYFGQFYIVGPDAQKAVDWIFTNNMERSTDSVVYTCMLNKNGGVEADLTVCPVESGQGEPCDPKFDSERGFYVAAGGGVYHHIQKHVETAIQDKQFNAQIIDHSDDMCLLSIQGPNSRKILKMVTSSDLSDGAFPFSTHQMISCAGHRCRALRLSFVGELGYELHVPNSSVVAVYTALMSAGLAYGLVNAGYRAIDALSLEKGYRLWTADLRTDDTPQSAGLLFTCKLKSETPFQGREKVEQQKRDGVLKRLAIFTIDKNIPLWGLEGIYRDGEPVGFLRRGDYAFSLKKSMGVGYVSKPDCSPVTPSWIRAGKYEIDVMGEKFPAKVSLKSLFDPENNRINGIY